jgi:hypothetical protein
MTFSNGYGQYMYPILSTLEFSLAAIFTADNGTANVVYDFR